MDKRKKHKLLKVSIIATIVILLLCVMTAAVVWQLRFSYSVSGIVIEEMELESETLEHKMAFYETNPQEFFGDLKNDNPFPSDDYRDYSDMYLSVVIKNDGLLELYPSDAYIERITQGQEIISRDSRLMVCPEPVKPHSEDEVGITTLLVCRGKMTDEEVMEILKDYKITVYAENVIVKNIKFEIYLKDYDMVIKPLLMPM